MNLFTRYIAIPDLKPIKMAEDAIDRQTAEAIRDIAISEGSQEERILTVEIIETKAKENKLHMKYLFNQRGVYQ